MVVVTESVSVGWTESVVAGAVSVSVVRTVSNIRTAVSRRHPDCFRLTSDIRARVLRNCAAHQQDTEQNRRDRRAHADGRVNGNSTPGDYAQVDSVLHVARLYGPSPHGCLYRHNTTAVPSERRAGVDGFR